MKRPERSGLVVAGGGSDDALRAFSGWEESLSRAGDATESHFVRLPSSSDDYELESDPAYASEPVELSAGESFAGLEVLGKLGAGGMATVYRARDRQEDTEVALKLLNRGLVKDSRHLQRFRREARLASRLRHPRIVTILTYGELGGCAYLTMQLVDGPTLADVVLHEGPLEPRRAARIVEQVARAIDAAHKQRVVHRDLKPSNIMLHHEDGPLVLDFGLAKDMAFDPTLTETGEILGTPAFLAPEQATGEGRLNDHRIDVYGLGAVLFFLLTGRRPHAGDSAIEVIKHILEHDPPRLREIDDWLPRPLEVVCAKALARDPRERYQTATDMADDLSRWLGSESIKARLPGALQRLARRARKHPVTTGLVMTVLTLLIGGSLAVGSLAERLALHERSDQGLALLEQAQVHAESGDHDAAHQEFLQAMLVTKGAFLEDPADDVLRDALARVKRERAAYAESRGNWALAEELRQNLARLEGRPVGLELPREVQGTIAVDGFGVDDRVVFHAWEDGQAALAGEADEADRAVSLPAGSYLAIHERADGSPVGSYLVVVDAGRRHELRLTHANTQPPPGVFRLPSRELLDRVGFGEEAR